MKLFFITFTFLVNLCPVLSQSSATIPYFSSDISTDTSAVSMYGRLMTHSYDLINGREYIPYHKANSSNPFFKSEINATGTVYSNGRTYGGLHFFYDINKDEVVLNHLNQVGYVKLIILNNHIIDSFRIEINSIPTTFKPFVFPAEFKIKSGFYEVPYNGKTKLLLRHKKESLDKGGYEEYPYSIQKYIYINNGYYPITTKSRFLNLFGDKKSILKKYMGTMNISSFRDINELEIISILEYYDNL